MKRCLALLIAAGAAMATLAGSAQATTPRDGVAAAGSTLAAGRTADVNARGTRVVWKFTVTCPRDKAFALRADIAILNPPAVPDLFGEDNGIPATGLTTGRCAGSPQTVTLRMTVRNTVYTDRQTGVLRSVFIPMYPHVADHEIGAAAVLSGSFATPPQGGYCRHPACAAPEGAYRVALG